MPLKTDMTRVNHLVVAVVGLLTFLSTGCGDAPDPPSQEEKAMLHTWLDESRRSPFEIVDAVLESGDTPVFIQASPLRSDPLRLIEALVPMLHDRDVTAMGVWFLDTEDQSRIDAYLESRDDTDPSDLLRSADASFGFAEYREFLVFIRDFNNALVPGESPFRLVALGENRQASSTVFGSLEEEDPPTTVLWLCREHRSWLENLDEAISHRPLAIYGPIDNPLARRGTVLPWRGLVDSVVSQRRLRDRSFGFLREDHIFPSMAAHLDSDWIDGYLIAPFPYTAVTPIPDFIRAEDAVGALEDFPDQIMSSPDGLAAWMMNRKILREIRREAKNLESRTGF